jgi:hypothetical protein
MYIHMYIYVYIVCVYYIYIIYIYHVCVCVCVCVCVYQCGHGRAFRVSLRVVCVRKCKKPVTAMVTWAPEEPYNTYSMMPW